MPCVTFVHFFFLNNNLEKKILKYHSMSTRNSGVNIIDRHISYLANIKRSNKKPISNATLKAFEIYNISIFHLIHLTIRFIYFQ